MFKKLGLLIFLCYTPLLMSSEPATFHQIAQLSDQTAIKIRGFLYENPQGGWILAAEPNLKSCCIGNKMDKQIFIENFLALPNTEQIVELDGILSVVTLTNGQRQYFLNQAKQMNAENQSQLGMGLLMLLGIGGFSWLLLRFCAKSL